MDCADAKKLANMLPTNARIPTHTAQCVPTIQYMSVFVWVYQHAPKHHLQQQQQQKQLRRQVNCLGPTWLCFSLAVVVVAAVFFLCTCYVRKFFENFWIFVSYLQLAAALLLCCCCEPAAKNVKLLTIFSFCNFMVLLLGCGCSLANAFTWPTHTCTHT